MRGSQIAGVVFVALLLGLGAWLYWGVEWVAREIDRGYSREAWRNDFLAAELFLREQGIETETVSGVGLLDALPPVSDVILLSAAREGLSSRRREALVEWIRTGGQLFVVAHAVFDSAREESEDGLLDELGVFLLGPEDQDDEAEEIVEEFAGEVESDEASSLEEDATASTQEDAEAEAEVDAEVATSDDAETLDDRLLELLEPPRCWDEALTTVSTETAGDLVVELSSPNELAVYTEQLEAAYFTDSAQLLLLDVGEGSVVALTSMGPFRNSRIHCHDHAFLLHYIVSNARKVWLMHDPDVPSLTQLVAAGLPTTALGGLLLAILFACSASLRFGVPPIAPEAGRRELREHLEASASFHFRKGGFAALHERLRDDLARARQSKPDDLEGWASRAGLSRADAEAALSVGIPRKRAEIVKRMRAMLRLRRTQ